MYLATGVIYAAAVLEDPTNSLADRITNFISLASQYQRKEIQLLGNLILEIILRE